MDIETLIRELVNIDKRDHTLKKDKIRELSELLAKAIREKNPRILNQLKIIGEPEEEKSILALLKWYRDKYNLSFSTNYIRKCISKKYIRQISGKGESPIIRLSDNYIRDNLEEIQERIKKITQGKAQDIKIKLKKDTIDMQGWKSLIALELVLLAKKIEEDENIDKDLEKEIADRIRMVRDGRFATTWSHYEAIIAAAETTKSLTHAIAEEFRPLTIDEIDKNQKNCRECYCDGMPKNKCNCHCHRTTQEMTTKGLKWAIKHNKKLGEFDERYKRIGNTDRDDLCPHIKTLFTNPNMDKHLSQDDKLNLLTKHIETENCIRCQIFLDEHPEFFKVGQ